MFFLIVTVLFVLLCGFLFIVSIINPHTGLFWYSGERSRSKAAGIYLGGGSGIAIILFILTCISIATGDDSAPKVAEHPAQPTAMPYVPGIEPVVEPIFNPVDKPEEAHEEDSSDKTKEPEHFEIPYSVISHDNNDQVENHNILIVNKGYSYAQLQEVASRAKVELCSRNCNINVYDSRQAYDLNKKMDAEEERLSDQLANQQIDIYDYNSQRERIERKYYVKVADHLVAYLPFGVSSIWFYPFQDTRYEELGGRNNKK